MTNATKHSLSGGRNDRSNQDSPAVQILSSTPGLWHHKTTTIAASAAVMIVLHLALRFGFQVSPDIYHIPLFITPALGGLSLLYDLLRKLLKREFGSDLSRGQNSDVTAAAASVVIMDNSLEKVDEFMHISRRMRMIALQSAVGGTALSVVGMAFASARYLSPVSGAIAQEIIDVLAVLNAVRAAFPPRVSNDFYLDDEALLVKNER